MADGRKTSHRKGVAIGHGKKRVYVKKDRLYTLTQMRRDVEAGWLHFWSHPKRKHLLDDPRR